VAGPPGMVEGVAEQLTEAGVPEEQILASRFSGY
jgi:NAD(P)H-flavin reductase